MCNGKKVQCKEWWYVLFIDGGRVSIVAMVGGINSCWVKGRY